MYVVLGNVVNCAEYHCRGVSFSSNVLSCAALPSRCASITEMLILGGWDCRRVAGWQYAGAFGVHRASGRDLQAESTIAVSSVMLVEKLEQRPVDLTSPSLVGA